MSISAIQIPGEPPFTIAYDDTYDWVVIDGVRCSTELLRSMFVAPHPEVLLSFRREGDTVTAQQIRQESK